MYMLNCSGQWLKARFICNCIWRLLCDFFSLCLLHWMLSSIFQTISVPLRKPTNVTKQGELISIYFTTSLDGRTGEGLEKFKLTRPSAPFGCLVLGGDTQTLKQYIQTKSLELFRIDANSAQLSWGLGWAWQYAEHIPCHIGLLWRIHFSAKVYKRQYTGCIKKIWWNKRMTSVQKEEGSRMDSTTF